ncbi:translationally-controlled tumor protein [Streptomyces wedmorensis]|uniref:translationally-controlled tumor protein n=1 Tax=Streptomyces wedmorensis TaxID=43759 RepID=UPI0034313E98
MIIYTDIFNGDELVSDQYPSKEIGPFLEVECKMITRRLLGDINIDESPLDEGEDDEAGTVTVNNVVDAHRLVKVSYDKKSYTAHLRAYIKRLREAKTARGDQDVAEWEMSTQAAVTEVLASFDDWEFLSGENMDPEAMVALSGWRGEDTPVIRFFKEGLKAEKY